MFGSKMDVNINTLASGQNQPDLLLCSFLQSEATPPSAEESLDHILVSASARFTVLWSEAAGRLRRSSAFHKLSVGAKWRSLKPQSPRSIKALSGRRKLAGGDELMDVTSCCTSRSERHPSPVPVLRHLSPVSGLPSPISRHPSLVTCLLSPVLRHPSPVLRHPSPVSHHLSPITRLPSLQSTIIS